MTTRFTLLVAAFALSACTLPPVMLETPEPVKVDINVRLDVYQHDGASTPATAQPAVSAAPVVAETGDIEVRRRNRMGDIQMFKNSRIVGENRSGLLEVRNLPPGEFGDYVTKTVADENADRLVMMRAIAEEQGLPLTGAQTEQARLWRERAFGGEWIEQPNDRGGWRWTQKGQD